MFVKALPGHLNKCALIPVATVATYILTNNAQELTPYRLKFKCNKNRKKIFSDIQRFEPRSLR
jgi:hypothetical protein